MRTKTQILKDKAWKVFAKWIRDRDKVCVSCKVQGKYGLAENAGHFFHNVLDFDEENINGQCVHCNKWLSGNLAHYAVYLLQKLGKKKFEALSIRRYRALKSEKHEDQYYLDIIQKYK